MTTIAIDDEPLALDVIRSHAAKIPFFDLKATFDNAFAAIPYLQANKVDLMFLDIRMPDVNGIDFLKSVNNPPMVVFTTAYSEHAVTSFELNAVDYLLKPFSFSRFLQASNKAYELYSLRNKPDPGQETLSIFIKDGYEQVKVWLTDILFVEAAGNYTKLFLKSGKLISTRISIADMQVILPEPQFIRTHRSFIAAVDKVTKFDRLQININDHVIPIGASYAPVVAAALGG